jgi:hypothetical protein
MLSYLVTSTARVQLLEVLWLEGARGSVSALAKCAVVSFASAYRELHEMLLHELVTATPESGVVVFAANEAHPLAAALRTLVGYRRSPSPSVEDSTLRAQLASLGAPVGSEAEDVPAVTDLEATVVAGAELSRREPATARAFPVLLYRLAERLDFERLARLARVRRVRHPLGFMLALAGKLGRHARLSRAAHDLRDHRVHRQPFFFRPPRDKPYPPSAFPLAYRWGFRLNLDEAAFASTFRRFAADAS